ncbi:MAG: phenylalanine--tRNA ligase subunit beta [Nitrosomonadales bacterium]|nr:phenylalanine--tRNA ligase subunit beta [Nitrosomonadales bacterium]
MQFSESWLRSLVDSFPPGHELVPHSHELADMLTMAGLEAEKMVAVAPAFDKVVVAQVLSKEKHPDADRLNLLKVDVGQVEPLDIVCGAQNVTVGMKAPCALVGAKLPGMEIKQAKVRGVVSSGMMCSAKELGLAEESSGLLELSADAEVGQSIRQHLDLDDHLITLKLTPNRGDCLSLYGIAREVAALVHAPFPVLEEPSFDQASNEKINVRVADVAACPRYTGRVIAGVDAKAATPAWMVRRLERCGLRSISAIVDVTNYVLLEFGQPLHAFDLSKLNGGITVRFALAGERIKLLNEQTIELQDDMLVIADDKAPVALAGVMGGADSAVTDTTTDIFLESAFFAPSVIVGKSRRLGFGSDSSYRFERGVDFAATRMALERATQLVLEICGGQAGAISEARATLPARPPILLRASRVERVLGLSVVSLGGADEVGRMLSRLGMICRRNGDEFSVTPPSYRFDIAIEEDLIEEIARVRGYENLTAATPQARMTMLPLTEEQRPLAKLRQALVLRDYQETINYAFVESEWERDLCGNTTPIALKNPIASQMSVMRSSLLGGLLAALRTNLARKQPRVRLFEMGGCFAAEAGGYVQRERVAGLTYGSALPEQWGAAARNVDFYDVKADVEALFAPATLSLVAATHPASHPGRSAQIWLNGEKAGWIGELHPQWMRQYDIPQPVVWFEVDLAALVRAEMPHVGEISRFPPVRRDLAVVVDEGLTVQFLLDAMRAAQAPNICELALFDLYRAKGVGDGKKSLAFRVLLQDTQKTLTDGEVDQSIARLVAVLQQHGAQLRM